MLPRFTGQILAVYAHLGLSPNQVTVAGFFIALAAATAVASGHNLAALSIWWLSRLLDGTDGIYARESGQVSDLGGFLDIVLDMAGYGAMVLGFAFRYPEHSGLWQVILFLYILCITGALALGGMERTRGLGRPDNRTLRLATGVAEGGETGIAYSMFLLFPAHIGIFAGLWVAVLVLSVVARAMLAVHILESDVDPATLVVSSSDVANEPEWNE
jgi:phosphatidylglycerophosphate synthase